MKRSPSRWSFRSPGAFRANEYDRNSFLPVLDEVLETNKPGYWEPIEPDVIIAFYPERRFPLLVNGMRLRGETPDIKNQKTLKMSGKNKAKSPDDIITMVILVDAYNFKDCDMYQRQGLALIMLPTKRELKAFRDDLKREWSKFKKQQNLEKRLKERDTACQKTINPNSSKVM